MVLKKILLITRSFNVHITNICGFPADALHLLLLSSFHFRALIFFCSNKINAAKIRWKIGGKEKFKFIGRIPNCYSR